MLQILCLGALPPPSGHGETWSLSKRGPWSHLRVDKSELYSPRCGRSSARMCGCIGREPPNPVPASQGRNAALLWASVRVLLGVGVGVGEARSASTAQHVTWILSRLRLKRVPCRKVQAAAGSAVSLSLPLSPSLLLPAQIDTPVWRWETGPFGSCRLFLFATSLHVAGVPDQWHVQRATSCFPTVTCHLRSHLNTH